MEGAEFLISDDLSLGAWRKQRGWALPSGFRNTGAPHLQPRLGPLLRTLLHPINSSDGLFGSFLISSVSSFGDSSLSLIISGCLSSCSSMSEGVSALGKRYALDAFGARNLGAAEAKRVKYRHDDSGLTADDVQEAIDELHSAQGAQDSDITDLDDRVTALEGDIDTINGNITTIEGDITSIENNITTINGNITSLNTAVSTKVESVTNAAATAYPLVTGTDNDPTIKEIKAGSNITITSDSTSLTIEASDSGGTATSVNSTTNGSEPTLRAAVYGSPGPDVYVKGFANDVATTITEYSAGTTSYFSVRLNGPWVKWGQIGTDVTPISIAGSGGSSGTIESVPIQNGAMYTIEFQVGYRGPVTVGNKRCYAYKFMHSDTDNANSTSATFTNTIFEYAPSGNLLSYNWARSSGKLLFTISNSNAETVILSGWYRVTKTYNPN